MARPSGCFRTDRFDSARLLALAHARGHLRHFPDLHRHTSFSKVRVATYGQSHVLDDALSRCGRLRDNLASAVFPYVFIRPSPRIDGICQHLLQLLNSSDFVPFDTIPCHQPPACPMVYRSIRAYLENALLKNPLLITVDPCNSMGGSPQP